MSFNKKYVMNKVTILDSIIIMIIKKLNWKLSISAEDLILFNLIFYKIFITFHSIEHKNRRNYIRYY